MRQISVFLLTMALAAANARAQTPFGITSAMANPKRADIVSVTFSDPLADTGPHTGEANVRIEGAPAIRATTVSMSALSPRMNVTVRLSAPLPGETKVQICFRRVAFLRDN